LDRVVCLDVVEENFVAFFTGEIIGKHEERTAPFFCEGIDDADLVDDLIVDHQVNVTQVAADVDAVSDWRRLERADQVPVLAYFILGGEWDKLPIQGLGNGVRAILLVKLHVVIIGSNLYR
jgi:hypothetical protein